MNVILIPGPVPPSSTLTCLFFPSEFTGTCSAVLNGLWHFYYLGYEVVAEEVWSICQSPR